MSRVYAVDEDRSSRDVICEVAQMSGLGCDGFSAGGEFLRRCSASWRGCVVLELQLPDMSGLEVQEQLSRRGIILPVVFAARRAELALAVRAMRGGAVHFLEKPLRSDELWDAIRTAVQLDRERQAACERQRHVERLTRRLTKKERQVLALIGRGMSHAEIADELAVSLRTVEARRQSIAAKLETASPAELVYYAVLFDKLERSSRGEVT